MAEKTEEMTSDLEMLYNDLEHILDIYNFSQNEKVYDKLSKAEELIKDSIDLI